MNLIFVVGIDPGLSGAIAGDDWVSKMPTTSIKKGKKKYKRILDLSELRSLAEHWKDIGATVYLETMSHIMPKMGRASIRSYATSWGELHGIFVGVGVSHVLIPPKEWQKAMLTGAQGTTKQRSLEIAKRRWPDLDIGKHDGKADALLICAYGRMREGEPARTPGA